MNKQIKNMRGGERNSLDLLKFVLAIIVVLRHCGQIYYSTDDIFVKIITNTISPIAVPIFFVISGYLFFMKKRTKLDLKRYMSRVLKLYGVWSLIYLPLVLIEMNNSGGFNALEGLKFIQKVFFAGTYYHLWYLPSLAVAIFLVYYISRKISNHMLIILGTLLYILGTLNNTYHLFSIIIYEKIFLTMRNGVFFGIFFIAIGKYIAEVNAEYLNKKLVLYLGIFLLFLEGYYLSWIQNINIVNMNFSSMILAPVIVSIVLQYTNGFRHINGRLLRNSSTFIYCVHPWCIYIIRIIGNKANIANSNEIILIILLCLIMGCLCSWLSQKFKILRVFF